MDNGLYVGLSGLTMAVDSVGLGEGVLLRKAYAHLMAPLLMAFQPAAPGQPHPAPWKAVHGGSSFEITAELFMPIENGMPNLDAVRVAETITFLVRMYIDPAVTMSILSNYSFVQIPSVPDKQVNLIPLEVGKRHFPLETTDGTATQESLDWVKQRWQSTYDFISKSAAFALGVDALSAAQFQKNTALILVSLWAALEAIFSPSTSELRFRVSALIAAYLEPPGIERAALQKEVAKLYDKRSTAVHGVPKHGQDDVLRTLQLVRRVLMAIVDRGRVPTKEDLEARLFGISTDSPSVQS
jgi:hypothetical protein